MLDCIARVGCEGILWMISTSSCVSTFNKGLSDSNRKFKQSHNSLRERSRASNRGGNCDNAFREFDCAKRVVRVEQVANASMLSHALLLMSRRNNVSGKASVGIAPANILYAKSTSTKQGNKAECK